MKDILKNLRKDIDKWLDKLLPPEDKKPETIHKAMRYSVFAGGKRLRPALCILAYRFCGGRRDDLVFPPACALELIHTYSLIHDDLPAMDDDDLRRGKPTSHKVYGEAMAILAGDALHALAFELLADSGNIDIIREVASNIGTEGLVGGQVVDIESENQEITEEELHFIHKNKTAALLRTSLRVGAIIADADKEKLEDITEYAKNIGLAFQVVDDILDIKGDAKQLGKPIGSDADKNKATYPRFYGLENSQQKAEELIDNAKAAICDYDNSGIFCEIANFILTRMN
ncbi:MAG: polyprenyl synthetase family protein [Candidatus Zixiibacteriota bacterium]